MPTIAAITIGQSPRDDVVPEMRALVPESLWIEAGALDGLDRAAIGRLSPRPGEFPLVTRLADRSVVVVGEQAIAERLQAVVRDVESRADLIVLLCSGSFCLTSRVPIVFPGLLLEGAVRGLSVSGRVLDHTGKPVEGASVFLGFASKAQRDKYIAAMRAENVPASPPGGSVILPIVPYIENKIAMHPAWPTWTGARGREIRYGASSCPRTVVPSRTSRRALMSSSTITRSGRKRRCPSCNRMESRPVTPSPGR